MAPTDAPDTQLIGLRGVKQRAEPFRPLTFDMGKPKVDFCLPSTPRVISIGWHCKRSPTVTLPRAASAWLAHPNAQAIHPGSEHILLVQELLLAAGTAGNLTTDAHLAALAIEHDATIVSYVP